MKTRIIWMIIGVLWAQNIAAFHWDHVSGQPNDSIKQKIIEKKVLNQVHFSAQSDSLLAGSAKSLQALADYLKQNPGHSLQVQVYVSDKLPAKDQVKLSELRARKVSEFFTQQAIEPARVQGVGLGKGPEGKARVVALVLGQQQAAHYGKAYIVENIKFTAMGDTLFASSYPSLNQLVKRMKQNPSIDIKVIGHASTSGASDYDDKVSLSRATTIKHYLVSKGIDPQRVVCEGRGDKEPLQAKSGEASDRNNRIEVSFKQAKPDKKSRVMTLKRVRFNTGLTQLDDEDFESLNKLATLLQKNPGLKVSLVSYTQQAEEKDRSDELTGRRSEAIKNYLVIKKGIDASRIATQTGGWKEKNQAGPNWVEVVLIK